MNYSDDNLPHESGGLLGQAAAAQLGDTSKNVTNSYSFQTQPKPADSAQVVGRNQSTGSSVGMTGSGDIVTIPQGPAFSSNVTILNNAPAAPTGLSSVSVSGSISVPNGVPSFTLITDNRPPQELTCPTVPTPMNVDCPPGFVATNGPALIDTEPGGCGGDNRYWYVATAPSLPVLPENAQQIQRVTLGGFNYLLAQGDRDMPAGIGCAWKYGGVVAFGCREEVVDFSPNGRLDPPEGLQVNTVSGGCSGRDGKEWYRNQECPFGSEELDSVDFRGDTYKLCGSANLLPPGIGCAWKYGNLVNDCATFDGCILDPIDGQIQQWKFNPGEGPIEAEVLFGPDDTQIFRYTMAGPHLDSLRRKMAYLTYPCTPFKSSIEFIVVRLDNVKTVQFSNGGGLDARLTLLLFQDGKTWPMPFNAVTFNSLPGGYESIYNGISYLNPNFWLNTLTTLYDSNATSAPDYSRPFTLGWTLSSVGDDYFSFPYVVNNYEVSFKSGDFEVRFL